VSHSGTVCHIQKSSHNERWSFSSICCPSRELKTGNTNAVCITVGMVRVVIEKKTSEEEHITHTHNFCMYIPEMKEWLFITTILILPAKSSQTAAIQPNESTCNVSVTYHLAKRFHDRLFYFYFGVRYIQMLYGIAVHSPCFPYVGISWTQRRVRWTGSFPLLELWFTIRNFSCFVRKMRYQWIYKRQIVFTPYMPQLHSIVALSTSSPSSISKSTTKTTK
jgi:hypothetical protein